MSRSAETGRLALLALLAAPAWAEVPAPPEGGYGLGRAALPEEVAAWDIDVRPDGQGLPEGSGDVETGEAIWVEQCAACHGDFGEAVGRWPQIAGGHGTLAADDPVKTPGSYWPYASTIFDYVHRAMPFGNAQSLSADETYALTAYILNLNDIVDADFVLTRESFAGVAMPNAGGFFMDDRAGTELPAFSAEACMTGCKDTVEITRRAAVIDVTPEEPSGGFDLEGGAADAAGAGTQAAAAAGDLAGPAAGGDGDGAAEASAGPDPALSEAGAQVFRKCQACHAVGEGAANRVGPHLNGLAGRPVAAVEGYAYSSALLDMGASGAAWDDAALHGFLADPKGFARGTKMSFAGLKKAEDIDAVIAYIRAQGG